jgi:hypothetical protein
MATEPPSNLLKLWRQEKITADMVIGYLIQNQVEHERAILAANLSRAGLRNDLDGMAEQIKTHQKMLDALQSGLTKLQSMVDELIDRRNR